MAKLTPAGYSAAQIGLHWIIATLVAFQLLFGDSMGKVAGALAEGQEIAAADRFLADAHYWVGLAIFALMLVRVVLRLTRGAPAAPESSGALQARIAGAVHALFYLMLLGMPLSGLAAVYVSEEIGQFHEIGKPIMIVMILVHIGAVVLHQISGHEGVMKRMMSPAG